MTMAFNWHAVISMIIKYVVERKILNVIPVLPLNSDFENLFDVIIAFICLTDYYRFCCFSFLFSISLPTSLPNLLVLAEYRAQFQDAPAMKSHQAKK